MKCGYSTGNRNNRRFRSAFTLIEMLLVVAIIGILAALIVPRLAGRGEDAKKKATMADIATLSTVLDAFEVDNGYYPKGKNGLQDLVVQPRDAQNWKGPYIKDVPIDQWLHPYVYECPGKHNTASYDLMSMGPDGRSGTEDDITNWKK